MIQIRKGVFETNSSSTHNMVIVPDSINGTVWIYDNEIISEEEKDKIILKALKYYNLDNPPIKEGLSDLELYELLKDYLYDLYTLEDWLDSSDTLSTSSENYTTPKGEKLTIYCKYGYND